MVPFEEEKAVGKRSALECGARENTFSLIAGDRLELDSGSLDLIQDLCRIPMSSVKFVHVHLILILLVEKDNTPLGALARLSRVC